MRVSDTPAHDHHQVESESEEQHRGEAILDADGFMVGGENVFLEEAGIVMVIALIIMRVI